MPDPASAGCDLSQVQPVVNGPPVETICPRALLETCPGLLLAHSASGRKLKSRLTTSRRSPQMKRLLIRLGLLVLGTVVTLLWWTYHDKGSSAQSISHIPVKVGQGGTQLVIEVEGSTSSTVRIDFEDLSKPSGQQILLNAWEKVPA